MMAMGLSGIRSLPNPSHLGQGTLRERPLPVQELQTCYSMKHPPPKKKSDLERSVSLLTPHYPSDHIQVVLQRPPLISSVSVFWVLICPLYPVSRSSASNSLARRSISGDLLPLEGGGYGFAQHFVQ
jgi:hypothetical protein